MIDAYLVTEGPLDAKFLSWVLPDALQDKVQCVEGQGGSGALSLARSILVARRAPVALVVDADTLDEREARQRGGFLAESLQSVAGSPFTIVSALPELEIIFIQPGLLRRLLGRPVTAEELDFAMVSPKKYLEREVGSPVLSRIVKKLSKQDATELQQHPIIQHLIVFLEKAPNLNPREKLTVPLVLISKPDVESIKEGVSRPPAPASRERQKRKFSDRQSRQGAKDKLPPSVTTSSKEDVESA